MPSITYTEEIFNRISQEYLQEYLDERTRAVFISTATSPFGSESISIPTVEEEPEPLVQQALEKIDYKYLVSTLEGLILDYIMFNKQGDYDREAFVTESIKPVNNILSQYNNGRRLHNYQRDELSKLCGMQIMGTFEPKEPNGHIFVYRLPRPRIYIDNGMSPKNCPKQYYVFNKAIHMAIDKFKDIEVKKGTPR